MKGGQSVLEGDWTKFPSGGGKPPKRQRRQKEKNFHGTESGGVVGKPSNPGNKVEPPTKKKFDKKGTGAKISSGGLPNRYSLKA